MHRTPATPAVIPIQYGRHYDIIKRAIPEYLIDASPEERAALRQRSALIPDRYFHASPAQRRSLKPLLQAVGLTFRQLEKSLDDFPSLEAFAQPLLDAALNDASRWMPMDQVFVQLTIATENIFGSGAPGYRLQTLTLLQAALYNFEEHEPLTSGSLMTRPDQYGGSEPYNTQLTFEQFVSLCRTLDIGRQYQEALSAFIEPVTPLYIAHQQALLAFDTHMALLNGDIDANAHALLMRDAKGARDWPQQAGDMRARLLAKARDMAQPSASANAEKRIERYWYDYEHGLFTDNLAAIIVSPLSDTTGAMLVAHLLGDPLEGYVEWSKPDQAAAWAHINDVLDHLAMPTARSVSPVIEKLKALILPDGRQCLWSTDLTPYRQAITLAPASTPDANGLYLIKDRYVLPHEGQHYVLQKDASGPHYRALHPTRPDAYQPVFRYNGHGVWVHEGEQPLTWNRQTLMRRLGPSVQGIADEQLEQILQVSGVEEDDLRRLYVENEPTPAMLVDSIRQFKARAQAQTLIAQVKAGGVLSNDGMYCAAFTVELEGWPAAKALEIALLTSSSVRYGSAQATGVDVITISSSEVMNGELPGKVVDALDQQHLETIFGEPVPAQREQRLKLFQVKLGEKMEKNIQRIVDSLYGASRLSDSPLRPTIESRLWFRPYLRTFEYRAGYPLFEPVAAGQLSAGDPLRGRYKDLYPFAESIMIDIVLGALGDKNPAGWIKGNEDEFNTLETTLNNWLFSPLDSAAQTLDSRFRISESLKQIWRHTAAQHNGKGVVLQLEGQDIGPLLESLPPLNTRFLHVSKIVLANTALTDAIGTFLTCFPNLRELDLQSNKLTRLPAAIAGMPDLESLDLAGNSIKLTSKSVGWLKGRALMRELTLDGSPLGLSPDIGSMPLLARISLVGCGLEHWPAGLFDQQRPAGFLLLLDDNPLIQNPETGLSADNIRLLARTHLTLEKVSEAVKEYVNELRDFLLINLPRRLPRAVSPEWSVDLSAGQTVIQQALWRRVELAAGSTALFEVISDQAALIPTRSNAFTVALRSHVWRMLQAMDESPALRCTLFEMARAPVTCVDADAQLFNALGGEVLRYEASRAASESLVRRQMIDLARGRARLNQLGRIARARVVELQKNFRPPKEGKIDEVAIYRDYTTQLAERLALPWSLPDTRMTSRDVSLARIENAYQTVIETEQGTGLRDQISEQPGWREYLESEYWSEFDQIRRKLHAAQRSRPVGQTSVAERDAKLRSIGVEYQQLVQTLTQQMLASDAESALKTALKIENNAAP